MSAYIVSDNTIHAIVKGFEVYQKLDEFDAENYEKVYSIIIDLQKVKNRIGQALLEQNYNSVNCRYREDTKTPKYKYQDVEIDAGVLLGCIDCYIYQACETKDFFESNLYNSLVKLKNAMLERMIKEKGYNIPWGYEA